jgi:predicted AAA+ superfamily ATPase
MSTENHPSNDIPEMNSTHAFKAYNKAICLEIPDYEFNHRPVGQFESDLFVGREKIKDDFVNVLLNGQDNGAYLVTGYRGMGKTSFVQKVINEYKNKSIGSSFVSSDAYSIEQLRINLNQSDLKEIDIFKQITKNLLYSMVHPKNWTVS